MFNETVTHLEGHPGTACLPILRLENIWAFEVLVLLSGPAMWGWYAGMRLRQESVVGRTPAAISNPSV